MSFWGATVITNMASAIPYIGTDLVQWIWGGLLIEPLARESQLKILLIAGISPIFENGYQYWRICLDIVYKHRSNLLLVKKPMTRRQSAGIINRYSTIVPQRLYAKDLTYAMLVGIIEGDGWISITKKSQYLLYEVGIELHIRDIQLIYKIKKLLGVGIVSFKEGKNKTVVYRIINKSHLINIIIPLFEEYPLLSNKQYDYLRFKNMLLNDIIYYKDLPNYTRPLIPINSIDSILNKHYFSAWLIGFIEAEGCFSIYKPIKNNNYVASFEITQTNEEILILAIRKYLSFSSNIIVNKTNNFRIKVSSTRSIENIIKFMDKAPVKLLGYKKLQYILWLKKIRTINTYTNKFIIPNHY